MSTYPQLFLASSSPIRQQLLREAEIPFHLLAHTCDEDLVKAAMPESTPHELVSALAHHKAASLVERVKERVATTPELKGVAYLLAADTVITDNAGHIFGKPRTKAEAVWMIQQERLGMSVVTGFTCMRITPEKIEQIDEVAETAIVLDMPDYWIEKYLEHCPDYSFCAGAVKGEGYGAQFWKELHGEYTTAMGLPMTQLRNALMTLGFFNTP